MPAASRVFEHVVIVGAGGIGTQLVDALITTTIISRATSITVVDFDVVEEKNLRNQLFSESEIGLPKAAILQTRLSVAGFAQTRFIQQEIQQVGSELQQLAHTLVFGCVDNVDARAYIAHVFPLVIDFGSEQFEGSVRFYGASFAPFDRVIFSEGLIPVCMGDGAIWEPNNGEIVTFAETNRTVVREGLRLFERYLLGDSVPDLTHINVERGLYVQNVFLKRSTEGLEEVWLRSGKILHWQEFGICFEGDMYDTDVLVI